MDDARFDSIAKACGSATNRRALLRGMVALAGGLLAGGVLTSSASAARRGYNGPDAPAEPNDISICPAVGCCASCVQSIPVIAQFVGCVQQQGLSCQYCAEHTNGCRLI